MPNTPTLPDRLSGLHTEDDHKEGEFADLFARKARTPLRGFLPGRRVWKAVGASVAAVLVITGSAAGIAAIDWGGDSDTVATAAGRKAEGEKPASDDVKKESAVPSTKKEGGAARDHEAAHDPVPGGSGVRAGARAGSQAEDPAPEPDASSDDDSETTGDREEQGSSSTDQDTKAKAKTKAKTKAKAKTDYLSSDGNVDADSNDYWDQSTVTVKSTTALTSLKVVLRVVQTGGVEHTGFWSSLGGKVNVSQAADSGQLAYVVTLKSGTTLSPGTYRFQFQYNHDEGTRDTARDIYSVTATSSDSVTDFRSGRF